VSGRLEGKAVDVMGAQLSRTPAEFESYVGGPGGRRRSHLVDQLRIDFGFILAYWAVFAATSGLLAARQFSAAVWLGVVAAECGTVAALLDVAENVQTLRLAGSGAPAEDEAAAVVRGMRKRALGKWFFAFLTTGLLSSIFLEQASWWDLLIGSLYLLAAFLGVTGVLAAAIRPSRIPRGVITNLLRLSFVLMALSLAVGLPFAAALV
jgi:hypothetical protein